LTPEVKAKKWENWESCEKKQEHVNSLLLRRKIDTDSVWNKKNRFSFFSSRQSHNFRVNFSQSRCVLLHPEFIWKFVECVGVLNQQQKKIKLMIHINLTQSENLHGYQKTWKKFPKLLTSRSDKKILEKTTAECVLSACEKIEMIYLFAHNKFYIIYASTY
jgi:hypothetical protein